MILAVDIGNTTIGYCGLERKRFLDYEICFRFKMDNVKTDSVNDYVQKIVQKIEGSEEVGHETKLDKLKSEIKGIAISSVVPQMTDVICQALKEIFGIEPFRISSKVELGITLEVDEPEKVGVDRLCDAAYAAADRDTPVITVDLGTSTTINVIDSKERFLGGSIMPGLETGFRALTAKAAQLYDTPLSTPTHFIGKNTSDCMNIGVVMGMAGAVDGIVAKMEQELGEEIYLLLTGGCAELVSPLLKTKHVMDPDLLSKGIAYIYEKNMQKKEVAETRKAWATGDAARDAGIVEPENLVILQDITYVTDEMTFPNELKWKANHKNDGTALENEKSDGSARVPFDRREDANKSEYSGDWHKLDIYYPECMKENQKKPVIVSMHGGGWFYADKELYRPYAMMLASNGYAVVNFNYRRSPENKYPCGFLDTCQVMSFLNANADKYGLDLDNLFLVGDSCGAQLVSQYCVMAGNEKYRQRFIELLERKEEKYDGIGYTISQIKAMKLPMPKKVAMNCGLYDGERILTHEQGMCEWYLEEKNDEFIQETFLNIMSWIDESYPSCYMMMSVNDGLNHHTPVMKKRLEELRVPMIYKEYGQEDPNDSHVFHLNHRSEAGKRLNAEELAFFGDAPFATFLQ